MCASQALDCIPFPHDGSSYLRADTAIDCASEAYLDFRSNVFGLIAVYQSIPVLWFWLLYRRRTELNPAVSASDPK